MELVVSNPDPNLSKKVQTALIPFIADNSITMRDPNELNPYENNPRQHGEKQLNALMTSIRKFGFLIPVLLDESDTVLAGHARIEAAKRLEMEAIPTLVATGMSKAQKRAFIIADNKIAEMATWDKEKLVIEMREIEAEGYSMEITGFSTAEIDVLVDSVIEAEAEAHPDDLQVDDVAEGPVVSKSGDLWQLGEHRLYCGDSREKASYEALMLPGEQADEVITDPPYNVKIDGHVCGSGKIQHDEFAMASGEMSRAEFTQFLRICCEHISSYAKDGAIVYIFMDWRHCREMLDAGEPVFGELRQLCVWAKDNAGMGTFYRSGHELIFIFKKGTAKHVNNFELGQHGRYRTNVWSYPSVNSLGSKGHEMLEMHPTVKPVSMIADAIRDCSRSDGIILDPFAGSGTILIAAERTGRAARAIEFEPKYVDVAITRWQRLTGRKAVLESTGRTFDEVLSEKCLSSANPGNDA